VGSGSHAVQTARIMTAFEEVCLKERPQLAAVVGDVNSTLACSITAKKLHIGVAHVEAGLRSGDMTMPEEVNRIVTDAISDYLFVSERSGVANLRKEGKDEASIFFVGNVMIDTLYFQLQKLTNVEAGATETAVPRPEQSYAVVTLHRPSNVDHREKLRDLILALAEISADMPVIFPVHPRTSKNIEEFGLTGVITKSNVSLVAPLSYMPFLGLWKDAALVLTDSGGLQEETTALGIPCFTIRENTERPVTVDEGTNILVGTDYDKIMAAYGRFKAGEIKSGRVPELWDGKTAERITRILVDRT